MATPLNYADDTQAPLQSASTGLKLLAVKANGDPVKLAPGVINTEASALALAGTLAARDAVLLAIADITGAARAAADILRAESGNRFTILTTGDQGRAAFVSAPGKNADTDLQTWWVKSISPGHLWPSIPVVNAAGVSTLSTEGQIPFDYSRRREGKQVRTVKFMRYMGGSQNVLIQQALIPSDTQTFVFKFWVAATQDGSMFSFGGPGGNYLDFTVSDAGTATANLRAAWLGAGNSAGPPLGTSLGYVSKLGKDGDLATGVHMTLVVNFTSYGVRMAINGIPVLDHEVGLIAWDTIYLQPSVGITLWVDEISGLSRNMTDDEVVNWRDGASDHPYLITAHIPFRPYQSGDYRQTRHPTVAKIGETGGVTRMLMSHNVRGKMPAPPAEDHPETPIGIWEQYIEYRDGKFVSNTATSVQSLVDPEFVNGGGQVASPQTIIRTYGPKKGWALQLYEKAINPFFTTTGTDLMFRRTPRPGVALPWENRALPALDSSADPILAAGNFYTYSGPAGKPVEYAADSDHPNMVVFVFYAYAAGQNKVGLIWTTDDGDTFTYKFIDAPAYSSEVTLFATNSGGLGITLRSGDDNKRYVVYAPTGPASLAGPFTQMPDYLGAEAAASTANIDPAGMFGSFGEVLLLRSSKQGAGFQPRSGLLLTRHTTADMVPKDSVYLLPPGKPTSYVDFITCEDNKTLIVAMEMGPRSYNDPPFGSVLLALRMPQWGVQP